MVYIAVLYRYNPDNDIILNSRPDHRAFIGGLHEQGLILGSGPFTDGDGDALIVLSLPDGQSIDDAKKIMDADPFHANGALESREFHTWNPVINSIGYTPQA